MDCPILCGGGGEAVPCPDKRCPLYEPERESCQLLSATRGEEPRTAHAEPRTAKPGRGAVSRPAAAGPAVAAAGGDLFGRIEAIESRLSLLAAKLGEVSSSSLEIQQRGQGETRGLLEAMATRLGSLEGKVGDLPERLTQLAAKIVHLADGMEPRADRGDPQAGIEKTLADGFRGIERRIEEESKRVEMRAGERDGARKRAEDDRGRALERIAAQVADLERRIAAPLGEVKETVQRLGARIAELPQRVHEEGGADAAAGVPAAVEALGLRLERLEKSLQEQAERDELRRLEGQEERRSLVPLVTDLRDDVGTARDAAADADRALAQRLEAVAGRLDGIERLHQELAGMRRERAESDEALRRAIGAAGEHARQETASIRADLSRIAARLERPDGIAEALEALRGEAREVLSALRERRRIDEENDRRARGAEASEQNSRGVLLFHEGALEAAAEAFRRAAELRPDYAEAHNNLGLALSRLGRHDDAVGAFRRALECDPDLPAALNNLGFLYHAQRRDAEAVEMFQKALQADPAMAPAYVNLGNAYYRLHRNAQAVEAWRRALEIDPVNEDAARALRSFDQESPGAFV
jgi:tetratricopeptide (TPR) repeat protein